MDIEKFAEELNVLVKSKKELENKNKNLVSSFDEIKAQYETTINGMKYDLEYKVKYFELLNSSTAENNKLVKEIERLNLLIKENEKNEKEELIKTIKNLLG